MSTIQLVPTVPLDIIETVIDLLAIVDDANHTAVKACSLTCRSVLHFCRKHIFGAVRLSAEGEYCSSVDEDNMRSYMPSQFQELLGTNPEIAQFVRKLTFAMPNKKFRDDDYRRQLSEMLGKFSLIQHLTLQTPSNACPLDWLIDVGDCLYEALLHLLDIAPIRYLSLSRIDSFPFSELARCVNLRHLNIQNCRNINSPPMSYIISPTLPTIYKGPIMLDEFTLGPNSDTAADQLLNSKWPDGRPITDFGNLTKFSVAWDSSIEETLEPTRQILRMATQLTSITLRVDVGDHLDLVGFAEIVSPSLKSLRKIILFRAVGSDYHTDPVAGLVSELEILREQPNVLEELEINVDLITFSASSCPIGDEWDGLDEALNDPGWSSLKTVSLRITGIPSPSLNPAYLHFAQALQASLPERQFPLLSWSKVVVFNLTVENNDGQLFTI